jgi:glycosyltransferase involved in cell wall biosynthesis
MTAGAALAEPAQAGTEAGRKLRLLTFSTLFPHAGRPNHGVFVENRLRHLIATGEASSTVIAPVPWFPSRSPRFGDWARHAMADRFELRDGLEVYHPRYVQAPKVGMVAAPASLFAAGALAMRRVLASGAAIDLIDAHYLYPDGVAAVALGRAFGKKVVVTARGSDITQYPDYAGPRRMIQWAMAGSAGLISVSEGLRQAMIGLGAPPEKVTTLRNGVDLERFRPVDAGALRASWGASGPVLLSVGHLIARKGHHLAIEALTALPEWTLVIVGEGPERGMLEALAERLGLSSRVILAGAQPHDRLAAYYSAADLLILASSREGWANVLLEAMACGTAVVASNIAGNPEVVQRREAGLVVERNTAECFAASIAALYAARSPRAATRAYAEGFSWDATSAGQLTLFRSILGQA